MTANPLSRAGLSRAGLSPATVAALARRPDLWATAVGAALSLAPHHWWRRAPFLPLPDPDWLRFRLITAHGGTGDGPIEAEELLTWLAWRRDFPGA